MKKLFAVLLVLCFLFATSAVAESLRAPQMDEIWVNDSLEDFAGEWNLIMVRSDEPVDMRQYRYVYIGEEGDATVNFGSYDEDVWFETTAECSEDGFMYLADENGENGAYYFLFDMSLMGCVDTKENPGTILYLQRIETYEEDDTWREELAAVILDLAGDVKSATSGDDFSGEWKCWSYSNDDGRQLILDPAYLSMSLLIDDEKVGIVSALGGEEDYSEAELIQDETCAAFYREEDDAQYYIFLRGEDELVLLDDPDMPTMAMFFYTAERWNSEEAAGTFDTLPDLGEPVAVESMDEIAGSWECTHIDYDGYIQIWSDEPSFMEIEGDAIEIIYGDESLPMRAAIEDGNVIGTDEDGYWYCFRLYENDVLVRAADEDDFSLAVYYQRIAEE